MVSEEAVSSRLQDLRRRDRIAADQLGARGELVERRLAEQTERLLRDPERATAGVFDWFVWGDYGTGTLRNTSASGWNGSAAMRRRRD